MQPGEPTSADGGHSATLDVLLGITAHREGLVLHRTLRAARRALDTAQQRGLSVRAVVNLDNPDELTERIAREGAAGDARMSVNLTAFEDVALARAFLADAAQSRFIVLLDGDDLFTDTFLADAVEVADRHGRPCAVFADLVFKFGGTVDPMIHRPRSTLEDPHTKTGIFEYNPYVSTCLASREIFRVCRHTPNEAIYGFEDWHWNTQVIAAGYDFIRVTENAFFYRQKSEEESQLRRHTTANTVLRPSPLLAPAVFRGLPTQPYDHPVPPLTSLAQPVSEIVGEIKGSIYSRLSPRGQRVTSRVLRMARQTPRRLASLRRGYDAFPAGPLAMDPSGVNPYRPSAVEIERWNRLNDIEPVIRFDADLIESLHTYEYTFIHAATTAYKRLCDRFGDEPFTDVVIVPWVVRGGADLAIVDLVTELSRRGRRVMVFTTLGAESTWRSRVDTLPGVTFLESHRWPFHDLDHAGVKLVIMRLIQNWGVRTLTVMNSSIGFEIVKRFGRAIRHAGCRVVAHKYAFPLAGSLLIEPFPDMAASLDHIDRVVVDSEMHRRQLQQIYGLKHDRITVVPLQATPGLSPRSGRLTHRVLFANRIAHEKRPDVAIRAVERLDGRVRLDLFGPTDDAYCERIGFSALVQQSPNVTFRGPFEGSETLDFDGYDICLLTSIYEGTPRIVLDALAANQFVICPDVGGLREVVEHGVNGLILAPDAGDADYAGAIDAYYASEPLQDHARRGRHNTAVLMARATPSYAELIADAYALRGAD